MNFHAPKTAVDFLIANRFIEQIAGAEVSVWFRLIHDTDRKMPAIRLYGSLNEHSESIMAAQRQGYGVFMVINEGGNKDVEISKVRAVFVDADNIPLPSSWHVKPDLIVQRDPNHWHAYWVVRNLTVEGFPVLQKRLAAFYGTDTAVCNKSRIMRLPGFLHQKGRAAFVSLVDHTDGVDRSLLGRDIDSLTAGLPLVFKAEKPLKENNDGSPITLSALREMLSYIDPGCKRTPWIAIGGAIHFASARALVTLPDMITPDPSFDGLETFADWSAGKLWLNGKPLNFEGPDDCEKDWLTFDADKDNGSTIGTIISRARKGGYAGSADRTVAERYAHLISPTETTSGIGNFDVYPDPIPASELALNDFPRVQYLIDGIIMKDHVNILYGDGGVGKTTLALNAAVLIATGKPFHSQKTMQARGLLVLAEDDYGETKHRLEAICAHFELSLAELPIDIWCLPGHDLTLASIDDDGSIMPRPFLEELRQRLRRNAGMFVVLDSLADVVCLDESQRLSVNAFLKRLLGGLCKEFGATILLLGHPSKTSMQDGTHYSGSTAFNNSVRSRLVLEQPVTSSNRRVLKVAKVNYGSKSDMELFLMGSVFLAASDAGRVDQEKAEREAVLATALEMIDKGISIVRSNGNGQKMRDVARVVYERHRITIEPARVLSILNQAESDCILRYRGADRNSRERAGFVRWSA